MPVESDLLRQSMRFWATGVTVVTSAHQGIQHGMTVSSFTSISVDPPQVLVSLAHASRTYNLVASSKTFGITILAAGQQEMSERFAGLLADDADRLTGLDTFTLASDVPLLMGGLTHLDCRVVTTLDAGASTVFIGEVIAAQSVVDGVPLLYFNRNYREVKP